MTGWLCVAGLGPGDEAMVTPEVRARIEAAIETLGGVVVWTHDSLSASDQFHADMKFDMNPRTIEGFCYHSGGMFVGSDAWSPDLHADPRRGTV